MMRSHHPILFGRVAGFEQQLAPRKNAKAPRNVFVGSETMETVHAADLPRRIHLLTAARNTAPHFICTR
jgi:hypothetical protein